MVQEQVKLSGGIQLSVSTGSSSAIGTNYFFDSIQEHSISLQSNITDNFVENNTSIQDHIAKPPVIITLRGLIGELVYTPPGAIINFFKDNLDNFLNRVNLGSFSVDGFQITNVLSAEKLSALPQFYPPVDNITQLAKNAAQYIESSVRRYDKIVKNFLTNEDYKMSRLTQVYLDLAELRNANALMIATTPYTSFNNMAIQSVMLRQGNEKYISDIEITLKQMNFAETQTTKPDETVMAKYNAYARAQEANNGKAQGVNADSASTLKKISDTVLGTTPGAGVRQ